MLRCSLILCVCIYKSHVCDGLYSLVSYKVNHTRSTTEQASKSHTYTIMACTLSHAIPQPHSLMSLPRELRDMVYTNVLCFPHSKSETTTQRYELHCSAGLPTIVHLSTIAFDWLDLMRTNGSVADEMRQLYYMPSYHTSATSQTWSMQLILNNDEYTLAWTSLPCPSSCVRHLCIDFKINLTLSKFGHWDNDSKHGPENILAVLLGLLSQITQHGPNITVSESLRQSIVFETLNLDISFADEEKPFLIPSSPESIYILGYGKRRIYSRLIEDMVTASANHVLGGKVKRVIIQGPKSLGTPKTDITIV
jgi:hypothetical protein